MEIRFIVPDLRVLDSLRCEAISFALLEGDGPPADALGLVDWRLAGRISTWMRRGWLTGAEGEVLLFPARPKLPFDKLFVFGGGRANTFDAEALAVLVDRMMATWSRIRVRASIAALPSASAVRPEATIEVLLDVAERYEEHDELTLLASAEMQRAMTPVVERRRRRTRSLIDGG